MIYNETVAVSWAPRAIKRNSLEELSGKVPATETLAREFGPTEFAVLGLLSGNAEDDRDPAIVFTIVDGMVRNRVYDVRATKLSWVPLRHRLVAV